MHDNYDESVHDARCLANRFLAEYSIFQADSGFSRTTGWRLHCVERSTVGVFYAEGNGVPAGADSVCKQMATTAPSEPTPQRVAAVREQLELLSDYL
jgi:hypothetical protein